MPNFAATSAPRAARTSSRSTTSPASPTACSPSTVRSSASLARAQAARDAIRDLRPRRHRLAADRGLPDPGLHRLPRARRLREDRDDRRADERARDRPTTRDYERLLPLLLRLGGRGAPDARRPHVVLVHDDDGDGRPRGRLRRRGPARALAAPRRPVARPRRLRRPLGADELRTADRALP